MAALAQLPSGDAGTRATLEVMADLVRGARTDLAIRTLAELIIADVPEKDSMGEASAVQEWVRDNIRYTADVEGVETVKSPVVLLRYRFGDCDDKAALAAALLQSIGFPVRLVAIAFSGEDFSHVYTEARVENVWVPVETTEPVPLGWSADNVARYMRVAV